MNAFITLDYETSLAKLALNGRPQPQETQTTPSWVNALKAIPYVYYTQTSENQFKNLERSQRGIHLTYVEQKIRIICLQRNGLFLLL